MAGTHNSQAGYMYSRCVMTGRLGDWTKYVIAPTCDCVHYCLQKQIAQTLKK